MYGNTVTIPYESLSDLGILCRKGREKKFFFEKKNQEKEPIFNQ